MKNIIFLTATFVAGVSAFPAVLEELMSRQTVAPGSAAAQALSKARTNCGPTPCLTFDPKAQLVSTTGQNAYASPAADEIRGPCPGLNAAANHGYLQRSGISNVEDTVAGLGAAYGMTPELGAALAAYAILIDGDPIAGTWSIGGPLPQGLGIGILGNGQGISYSHNKYEGDASIGRNDAYLGHGDAHSLNTTRFAQAYAVAVDDNSDRYTLDKFASNFGLKVQESISNNPYYFSAPFATFVVSPAAYNFVINFMSNHSAEEPSGYLDGDIFKTFFAVSGTYPNFQWNRGQERIPDNWYRRPLSQGYTAHDVAADVGINYLAYPDSARLGGNTNGVNTYVGFDLGDLTGGAYNLPDLIQPDGNNLGCFIGAATQAALPDFATLPLNLIKPATDLLNKFVTPFTGNLQCPQIAKFSKTAFDNYPGHSYSPTGPDTNYKG